MSAQREPVYQPTPHRRRTPCCEIEAYRYLSEHGFGEAEAAAQERERIAREIEGLYFSRHVLGYRENTAWVRRAAVLAIVRGEDA